jgi:GntR family transcriptional repressor for pyruvate dehydrogenase complex
MAVKKFSFKFEPVRTIRLTDVVRQELTQRILSGELTAGERLPDERELASQFNVSLIVVKQSLSALEALGLITKKTGRNGGPFVRQPEIGPLKILLQGYLGSRKFTREHFQELRSIIEPEAARLAALRIRDDSIDKLESNLARLEEAEKAMRERPSHDKYVEMQPCISDFHRLVAEATQNPLIILVTDYLMDVLSTIALSFYVDYTAGTGKRIVTEHREILTVLKSHDAESAQRRMLKHVLWAGKELGVLEKRGNSRTRQ